MSSIKSFVISPFWTPVLPFFMGMWFSFGIMSGNSLAWYASFNGHGTMKIIIAFLVGFVTWPFWLFS